MPDIHHRLTIEAPPAAVWPHLTTVEGVAGWWSIGHTEIEGGVGCGEAFRFHSRQVRIGLEVIEAAPPSRLVWRATEANAPGGWPGSSIVFRLTPADGGTALDFTHMGLAESGEPLARVTAGWAHYLGQLKRRAEHPDAPFTPAPPAPQESNR